MTAEPNTFETRDDLAPEVRQWLQTTRQGTLSTLGAQRDVSGFPYGSIVPFAVDGEGRPFVLLARIAAHTANLRRDPRASLLVSDPDAQGDPQASWRVSLIGRMAPLVAKSDFGLGLQGAVAVPDEDFEALHARYCERVPGAEGYRQTHDFDYWRLDELVRARAIAGFGRIRWLGPDALRRDPNGAGIGEAREGAIAHMNEDHGANLVEMCQGLYGFAPAAARMTALDRTGFLVRTEGPERLLHFSFGREIDAAALRPAVIDVLTRARAAGVDAPARG